MWGWGQAKWGNGNIRLQAYTVLAKRPWPKSKSVFLSPSPVVMAEWWQGLSKVATLEVTILITDQLCLNHMSIQWL